jgi:hypothetical protein
MEWEDRASELLYAGESLQEAAAWRSVGLAVTSHRVLASTPERDGPNLRVYQRPNVTAVEETQVGPAGSLVAGAKWLVLGVALAVAGAVLDLEGTMGSVPESGAVGVEWIGGVFGLFRTAFALLDDVLLLVGLVGIVAGIGFVGWYLFRRETVLRLSVAGDADLDLPASGLRPETRRAIDAALSPGADDSNPSNG